MALYREELAHEALELGLKAEHADDLQRALHHYADAAIHGCGNTAVVAKALTRQAGVYRRLSEWDIAADYARRARDLADGAHLPELHAEALVAQGNALMCSGRHEEAAVVYHRLVRVATDDRQRGIAMQNLGSIHAQKREFGLAAEAFDRSRYLFRAADYARGEVIAVNNLGRLAHDQGDLVEAETLLREALAGAREVADAELAALALINLAQVRVARGVLTEALPMATEAFGHFSVSENRWRQIECLCVLADIAAGEGEAEQEIVHLRRAREIARAIGAQVELKRIEARLAER